ncbi:MAG: thiamine-phosphate kinase [Gammaproteobacteria bacterium]|jgi:thiamine-monophosphate kinase
MPLSEFDVIERFFREPGPRRNDVVLGIGDDAALLAVPSGRELAVALDTLVAGRHFLPDAAPVDIGYKALAVNLSDLAAMGAEPAWVTLSLTLPAVDEAWLQSFADGFFALAMRYGVQLVGGDTTRGPLSVTVQVHGLVEHGRALRRDTARPGQRIFVTGTLGDAAYALRLLQAGKSPDPYLLERLNRPEPRVDFGKALTQLGAAAIDVSDGLLADLGHILTASGCGATVWVDRLPRSEALAPYPADVVLGSQLSGGDDYELCLCVEPERTMQLRALSADSGVPVTEVGLIEAQPDIRCCHDDGSPYLPRSRGFDHFA